VTACPTSPSTKDILRIGELRRALTATLHKTVRGQGAGGVRHWPYAKLGDLSGTGSGSRGNGPEERPGRPVVGRRKASSRAPTDERYRDVGYRRALYEDYGRFVTSLRGVRDGGRRRDDSEDMARCSQARAS
jgi:hypothetical protein